ELATQRRARQVDDDATDSGVARQCVEPGERAEKGRTRVEPSIALVREPAAPAQLGVAPVRRAEHCAGDAVRRTDFERVRGRRAIAGRVEVEAIREARQAIEPEADAQADLTGAARLDRDGDAAQRPGFHAVARSNVLELLTVLVLGVREKREA